jgi:hypothetical protein
MNKKCVQNLINSNGRATGVINMKIYVLLRQTYEGSETVCVSVDINKIRTSICSDFYPELEIWENEEMIYQTSGSDVLKAISKYDDNMR